MAAAVALTVVAGIAAAIGPRTIATFLIAAVALAALAALIGQSVEQVGERFGPGPTGLLQSALGNLPELFVGIFALREGLVGVVQAALVGSILANTLLVLGVAVLVGGLRHGDQSFTSDAPHMIGTLLLLAVAALLVPTLASHLHTPAASHTGGLSGAVAIVLIGVYAMSIPYSLRGGSALNPTEPAAPDAPDVSDVSKPASLAVPESPEAPKPASPAAPESPEPAGAARPGVWPLGLAITLLAVGSLGAAVASDWFVGALTPATHALGLSQTFTGLVIVAIASNAVENVVGIRFALTARPDYALSIILNSPLQIALLLTPLLVLVSHLTGPTQLTLVFPALEVCALALATIVVLVVLVDGKYVWLEGVALIGLYCIVAAAFWWG
ncbi:MAG: calcium/proton exchanger [Acidimicrobiales bacterium]